MTSLHNLTFSEINFDNNNKKIRKNKTFKQRRRKVDQRKVENFLNNLENHDDDQQPKDFNEEEGEEGLADFKPPPLPQLTKGPTDDMKKHDPQKESGKANDMFIEKDESVTPEGYDNMVTDNYKSYYDNYIPYYNNPSNQQQPVFNNKDELMRKLNYLIHLMEENKDEKSQNVTEELVLYLFLGVFVIFVVDSFARAGKYTR
tara:strand:+ start:235 stop:840 length:606 start_codon:yes stop_codon:yes gene_type:complete